MLNPLEMERYIHTIAKRANLRVVWEHGPDSIPRTDGRTVWLPAMTNKVTAEEYQEMRHFVVHEVDHILHTNYEHLRGMPSAKDNFFGAVINCIEDLRVEKKGAREYVGDAMNSNNVKGRQLENIARYAVEVAKTGPTHPQYGLFAPSAPLLAFAQEQWSDVYPSVASSGRYFREACSLFPKGDERLSKLEAGDFADVLKNLDDTKGAVELAKRIMQEVYEVEPQPQQQQGGGGKEKKKKDKQEKPDEERNQPEDGADSEEGEEESEDDDNEGKADDTGEDNEGDGEEEDSESESEAGDEEDQEGTDEGEGEDEGDEEDEGDGDGEADSDDGDSEDEGDEDEGESDSGEDSSDDLQEGSSDTDADDGSDSPNDGDESESDDDEFTEVDFSQLCPDPGQSPEHDARKNGMHLNYKEEDFDPHRDWIPAMKNDYEVRHGLDCHRASRGRGWEWYFREMKDTYRRTNPNFAHQVRIILQVRAKARMQYGQKRGKLHQGALHRLFTDNKDTQERVFKRKEVTDVLDSAVFLLVDQSGSMSGEKYSHAATAAAMMSETIGNVLHIPCFIASFTEESSRNGTGMKEWMFIHRQWHDKLMPTDKLLESFSRSAGEGMGCNSDGDSIMWAFNEIITQRAKRKLIIVFSDGSPAAMRVYHGNIAAYTKQVVESIEKETPVNIVGIGIQDQNVCRIYKEHYVIEKVDELEKALLSCIERKLK